MSQIERLMHTSLILRANYVLHLSFQEQFNENYNYIIMSQIEKLMHTYLILRADFVCPFVSRSRLMKIRTL